MRFISTLLLLIVIVQFSFAQQIFSINGKVVDQKSEPLAGVSVYVSGSKIATVTDNDGKYNLKLEPGNYDLLFKSIGYKSLTKKVILQNEDVSVDIRLLESTTKLADVNIKSNPYRDKDLERFKALFIGVSPNAKYCKIQNPSVLDFVRNQKNNNLTVYTSDFLIIENNALGYKLNCLLQSFEYDEERRRVSYKGSIYFEDLAGTDKDKKRWNENRVLAYKGSSRHFFNALFKKELEKEGFLLVKIVNQQNSKRPSDSVLKANIARLMLKQQQETGLINIKENDSLTYWLNLKKMPVLLPKLNAQAVQIDTLVHKTGKNFKAITSRDNMFVVYTKADEEAGYINSFNPMVKDVLNSKNAQVSQIKVLTDQCEFSSNGILVDPQSIYFSGYWGWKNMSDNLPIDYIVPQ
ncbi:MULTISPECIES: carboxypeptidase-like regulatory domain-containing protein [unclassified Pedobacter]|uniref:carboxypeptidase-like regulatory domain-containing protein n=1 Tax=unclassified Pedobacter TaxID=2628915 RepID=UPI001E37277F|nr:MULTISPECIES: carboxypeptidase-like regulatory domain-containing protein [unclassified Pedobacter]